MRRHQPRGCLPMGYAPMGPTPMGVSPTGVGPTAFAPGLRPSRVAPVQRMVYPTQTQVRQRTTRYPIQHVFPVHTHHVNNHIREHHCRTVYSQSHQDCCYDVNVNCPKGVINRRPY